MNGRRADIAPWTWAILGTAIVLPQLYDFAAGNTDVYRNGDVTTNFADNRVMTMPSRAI